MALNVFSILIHLVFTAAYKMSSFSSDSEDNYSSDDDLWEFKDFGSVQTILKNTELS